VPGAVKDREQRTGRPYIEITTEWLVELGQLIARLSLPMASLDKGI
jgi:hypothetical protein